MYLKNMCTWEKIEKQTVKFKKKNATNNTEKNSEKK